MKNNEKVRRLLVVMAGFLTIGLLFPNLLFAGDLDPGSPPAPSMNTLKQIYEKPVWQIGDTEFVDWPANPRFAISPGIYQAIDDDLVLDKETGLIWPRNGNIAGATKTWPEAEDFCHMLKLGGRMGWRLPTIEELSSLIDTSQSSGLPPSHPFINVSSYPYWSTTRAPGTSGIPIRFWYVQFAGNGWVNHFPVLNPSEVWPVRGGSGRIMEGW